MNIAFKLWEAIHMYMIHIYNRFLTRDFLFRNFQPLLEFIMSSEGTNAREVSSCFIVRLIKKQQNEVYMYMSSLFIVYS